MPWFPDFVGAVELARRQTRAAAQADPVGQYLTALNRRDTGIVEAVWPGKVVVYDPHATPARSAATNGCGCSSDATSPGLPSAAHRWPQRTSVGGPWSSCWRTWPTTGGNRPGRWRSSSSLRTRPDIPPPAAPVNRTQGAWPVCASPQQFFSTPSTPTLPSAVWTAVRQVRPGVRAAARSAYDS